MIELCLTRSSGTSTFGLFRGLTAKTAGTPWAVEFFQTDEQDLYQNKCPALLTVWLNPEANVDPRYEREWGWRPGLRHAVVLFARENSLVKMGDPAIGMERWGAHSVTVLWHGMGFRLVPRR